MLSSKRSARPSDEKNKRATVMKIKYLIISKCYIFSIRIVKRQVIVAYLKKYLKRNLHIIMPHVIFQSNKPRSNFFLRSSCGFFTVRSKITSYKNRLGHGGKESTVSSTVGERPTVFSALGGPESGPLSFGKCRAHQGVPEPRHQLFRRLPMLRAKPFGQSTVKINAFFGG